MTDLAITPPVLILMVGAAGWTYWRAIHWPQSIAATARRRAGLALVEGSICALVWTVIELWVAHSVGTEALLDGLFAGLMWAASSWWSANRFSVVLHQRKRETQQQPSHPIHSETEPYPRTNGTGSRHEARRAAPLFQMEDMFTRSPANNGTHPLHAQTVTWPVRIGYLMAALLSGGGVLLFWALLFDVSSPWWSRPALLLQLAAFVLIATMLVTQTRPPVRFVLYPIVLAALVYLWDTTLPPPNLPEGPLRHQLPRFISLALFIDVIFFVTQRRRAPQTIEIRGGLLTLDAAAALIGITVPVLRQYLGCVGRSPVKTFDGSEKISLDDLERVLDQVEKRDTNN